jgi:hypothetical protein
VKKMEQCGFQLTLSTAFLGGGKLTAPWAAATAAQTASTEIFMSRGFEAGLSELSGSR